MSKFALETESVFIVLLVLIIFLPLLTIFTQAETVIKIGYSESYTSTDQELANRGGVEDKSRKFNSPENVHLASIAGNTPFATQKNNLIFNTYWHNTLIVIVFSTLSIFGFFYYRQKKKQEHDQLAYNTDSLTGVMSFPYFRKKAEEVIQTDTEYKYEIISVDIDLFKTINSYFGMEVGTKVIKALAYGLSSALENTDSLITRRNAEQFIILRKVDENLHIKEIYDAHLLPPLKSILGEKYNISMSFGLYTICNKSEDLNTILAYADEAKLQGKKMHKTSFIDFNKRMKQEYKNRIDITFRMEQALKNKEFKVLFQPKIKFTNLTLGGAEALVRWTPNRETIIFPDTFIPIFEKNGFIVELDMYVFHEVCRFIQQNRMLFNMPKISVNLSGPTATNEYLIDRVLEITTIYNIQPKEIEFEITESAIEINKSVFLSHIKKLKEIGFGISIDDFGAGVSSLHRISQIDADTLKLDKAFFDQKDQDSRSTIIVEDVIKMAKHLNMKIVAEGVETAGQALWLKSLKCEYAQGYYFEKPLEEVYFKSILQQKKEYEIIFDAMEIFEESVS